MSAPLSILVHGGAGPHREDDDVEAAKRGCLVAARAGHAVLKQGGSALDAIEAAVRLLEDDPVFNAGIGAALNRDGTAELDASVMNGATLAAGSVACVTCFQNPITLARRVMEQSPHVMLVAQGAEAFGRAQGLPVVSNEVLVTAAARRDLETHRRSNGTVGAVAIDGLGHLAAATSTGGTTGKWPGRVGDSPLIGCGTYADDKKAAVSCTGLGEAIIRVTLARHAADLVALGLDGFEAARQAVSTLQRAGGDAGLILVTPAGQLAWAFSTQRMSRAWVSDASEGAGFGPADG
jgi:L-asparaginase / beta-aspartyl-peptidase